MQVLVKESVYNPTRPVPPKELFTLDWSLKMPPRYGDTFKVQGQKYKITETEVIIDEKDYSVLTTEMHVVVTAIKG